MTGAGHRVRLQVVRVYRRQSALAADFKGYSEGLKSIAARQ